MQKHNGKKASLVYLGSCKKDWVASYIIHQEREYRKIRGLSGDKPKFMHVEMEMSMVCPNGKTGSWSHPNCLDWTKKQI